MSSTGIAVGLKKGYPVEKRVRAERPSNRKAVSNYVYLFALWSGICC
jgi:hypothetical protein